MRAALEALEVELRSRAPYIADALRPGLSAYQLAAISGSLEFEIPSDLQELYLWRDGTEVVHADDRAQLFPGGQMLPFAEAAKGLADALEGDRRSGQSLWHPRWLPVFTDKVGGWHVVVCGGDSHPVLDIYFVDLPDTVVAFSSLTHMVEMLVRRWRAGAYWQVDLGVVSEDRRAVAAIYRAEDSETPNFAEVFHQLNEGSIESYLSALALMRTRLYPESVPWLIRMLEKGTPRGRKAAAELLGSVGDPAARSVLKHASESDPDGIIRTYATKALEQLDG